MAAMTTNLEGYSQQGNSRTYLAPAHTVSKPVLVLQKRKVPSGTSVVAEDTITVLQGTEDSDGVSLSQKVGFTVTIRRPITGIAADVTSAKALFREIVASDEFDDVVDGSRLLQD